jgi:hypothetical protein
LIISSKKEHPLKVHGGFNDLLRAAVSGNPKPSTEESEEKKDEEPKEGEKN